MTDSEKNRTAAVMVRIPDMNPGPVLQLDKDCQVLVANLASRERFGESIQGSDWKETCTDVVKHWDSILHGDSSITIEQRINDRDYSFAHRLDAESGVVFVFGSDITDLKNRDRAVREMARFPDMNPGPVVRLSQDQRVLMANQAAKQILGNEVVGSEWSDHGPSISTEEWQSIVESPDPVQVEHSVDGRDFALVHQSDPESGLVFVFGSDITELNVARGSLAEVARFPDMNPGPVLRLDLDATVLISNRAAREVFGQELDGQCWWEVCEELTEETWESLKQEPDKFATVESKIKDHDYLFIHRLDPVSNLVFVFGTDVTEQRRLEEEVRQTEKMSALGKLSAGLAHELNNPAAAAARAADQLHQAVDQLKDATAGMSEHQINAQGWNSVTAFENTVQERKSDSVAISALELSDREEEMADWLESISFPEPWEAASIFAGSGVQMEDLHSLASDLPEPALNSVLVMECRRLTALDLADVLSSSAKSISTLVGAVKSYSYMDRAPVQNADIHKGIEDTVTILHHKLKNGIQVVRDYDTGIPLMEINGSELNQVWTNLIDNAADAMGDGGILTLRTRMHIDDVEVEIQDDGPGIPSEIQDKIFDPFYTTKEVGTGTGLGLDVVHRIVTERNAGKIAVRSKPGETIFTVTIPIKQSN